MPNSLSKPTFAERTAERQAQINLWQNFNAETVFEKDLTQSLHKLAELSFPEDKYNQKAYQEAIVDSLTETISPEIGVKDFWKEMEAKQCHTLKIEHGHLSFYDHQNQKIDLTPFTQPIIFEAHSSFYQQRQLERQERITKAQQQLQDLLQEIQNRQS